MDMLMMILAIALIRNWYEFLSLSSLLFIHLYIVHRKKVNVLVYFSCHSVVQ